MQYQVEYRGSDLFRAAHTDLDGDVLVDDTVDLTCTGIRTEREHDIRFASYRSRKETNHRFWAEFAYWRTEQFLEVGTRRGREFALVMRFAEQCCRLQVLCHI